MDPPCPLCWLFPWNDLEIKVVRVRGCVTQKEKLLRGSSLRRQFQAKQVWVTFQAAHNYKGSLGGCMREAGLLHQPHAHICILWIEFQVGAHMPLPPMGKMLKRPCVGEPLHGGGTLGTCLHSDSVLSTFPLLALPSQHLQNPGVLCGLLASHPFIHSFTVFFFHTSLVPCPSS